MTPGPLLAAIIAAYFQAGRPAVQAPRGEGAQPVVDLHATLRVSRHLVDWRKTRPEEFYISFDLANEGKQAVNPNIEDSQLLINGCALESWSDQVRNGLRGAPWNLVAPDDRIEFLVGFGFGKVFCKPGLYVLRWVGKDFRTIDTVIVVWPSSTR